MYRPYCDRYGNLSMTRQISVLIFLPVKLTYSLCKLHNMLSHKHSDKNICRNQKHCKYQPESMLGRVSVLEALPWPLLKIYVYYSHCSFVVQLCMFTDNSQLVSPGIRNYPI